MYIIKIPQIVHFKFKVCFVIDRKEWDLDEA